MSLQELLAYGESKQDLWAYLGSTQKPILLYGMGDGAEKIISYLGQVGKKIDGIFASDQFVRGHSFAGFKVMTYAQAKQEFKNFIVLVGFGSSRPEVLAAVAKIGLEQELYVPNVPLFGTGLFDSSFVKQNFIQLSQAYALLADEKSRQVFLDYCLYSLTGRLAYLNRTVSSKAEGYALLQLGSKEVYWDLGAYNGDTVREFLQVVQGSFGKILALEPDKKNFAKLTKNTANLPNVLCLNLGLWQETTTLPFGAKAGRNSALESKKNGQEQAVLPVISLDALLKEAPEFSPPTFIKFDVEGAEQQGLLGGGQVLSFRPKLLVSAYHRNEDIFVLPKLLQDANPNYKIYLRRHPYFPAWDLNFYAL